MIIQLIFWFSLSCAESGSMTEPILPIPLAPPQATMSRVRLGQKLFNDPRLSKDNSISCASCHVLSAGGDDGRRFSLGIKGASGSINAPSVFNGAYTFRFFWNGRARSLGEQVEGPVTHPKEMGSTWDEVLAKLKKDQSYVREFSKAFKDGITRNNVKDSIESFEKQLTTPNARFDKFLRGDKDILTENELRGYQIFKSSGCIACHQGVNVGGNMFQVMGIMGNYFKDRGTPVTEEDLGRYAVTKNASDKFYFKVPSLRNVELTAPYFHDGSAQTLDKAVEVMAKYQLGKELSKKETELIVQFLKTLTGEMPAVLRIPASEEKTP